MNKKHGFYIGTPLMFNHDGRDIIGKITKLKETASCIEFTVTPMKDKIYISLDQAEEFVWGEDSERPIGVIFPKNSTDLLEVFEEFKNTAKFKPSEIYDAISKKAKPDDSLMAKIFGSKSFIEDYPHPDIKPKICDLMVRDESLELHCEVCNKYFKPVNGLHYIAKSHTTMFMVPDVETFHDAYDCPRCGSQILVKERAPEAK